MSLKEVLFSDQRKEKLNWGDALGLWDIANFKVIGMTQIEFFSTSKRCWFKNALEHGIEMIIVPHIEKIQGALHSEGAEAPSVPQRKTWI